MRYPFFNSILKQLNRKLKYDAAVGYAGNSFFKESSELINESNPMRGEGKDRSGSNELDRIAAIVNASGDGREE